MIEFLKNLWCAIIVFFAYLGLRYYGPFDVMKAVRSYFAEKTKLCADILTVERFGIPIGTLMCARDQGCLPTDRPFPMEMDLIRDRFAGRIGYFGKFAAIPCFQGRLVGKQLLIRAITEWAISNRVDVAVMIVNPRHAPWYRRFGAKEVGRTEGTEGLDKAPAVLMYLDFTKSPVVQAYQLAYRVRCEVKNTTSNRPLPSFAG